jgi:hypothetical protein
MSSFYLYNWLSRYGNLADKKEKVGDRKMSSPFAPERRTFPKSSTKRKKENRRKI